VGLKGSRRCGISHQLFWGVNLRRVDSPTGCNQQQRRMILSTEPGKVRSMEYRNSQIFTACEYTPTLILVYMKASAAHSAWGFDGESGFAWVSEAILVLISDSV
jgi:hypothetical protein